MKVVDPVKYRRIYEDVMKKLDKLENEFLPQVSKAIKNVGSFFKLLYNVFHSCRQKDIK